MENLLNRGLNFAILPLKLDLTQVLVDFARFERSLRWKEFCFGKEIEEERKQPIFKVKKNNLPKNHSMQNGLKTFIGAVKSEILDPNNRNKVDNNITDDEVEALKELIKLQKDRKIVIKPCDKGAGIIILDFDEYEKACKSHLESSTIGPNGSSVKFYAKVEKSALYETKEKIKRLLQEGVDNNLLTSEEFKAMNPDNTNPSKFYLTFKVHKKHEIGKAPPERPIVSGSGSPTENIGLFVEHHIKHLGTQHKSYLQDTPDFLRKIEQINNEKEDLPKETILASIDVTGLYTNIPQDEGLECTEEALDERKNPEIPTGFFIRMLEIVLKNNIFEYDSDLFIQLFGAAMGSRPIPGYANIFMDRKIDRNIEIIAEKLTKSSESTLKLFKRFLDDLFFVFIGSSVTLHRLLDEMNNIHPSIKFTMTHTTPLSEMNNPCCACPIKTSIPYLDTSCSIKNGKIILDLYRKETDRNQYLLTSSCHPSFCTRNIPYSLATRINRICSEEKTREMRFKELKSMLLSRGYGMDLIDAGIEKARAIPRTKAIKYVSRPKTSPRPVFAISFDPRLPSITDIQNRHWRSMVNQDPYLREVFPQPPLTAFKRPKNLKDLIIRAKVSPKVRDRPERKKKGMKRCNKMCPACPFINESKLFMAQVLSGKYKKVSIVIQKTSFI